MPHSLRYLWSLFQQAAHDWWDWFWGDTVIGSVVALGMAIFGALVLPKLASKFPTLQRFAGGDTVDSVINAAGAAVLFAVACFVLFLIRAPWQIHAEQEKEIARMEMEVEGAKMALADRFEKFKATLPNMTVRIQSLNEVEFVGLDDYSSSTFVLMAASVRNYGAPSLAERWSVVAILEDGSQHKGELILPKGDRPLKFLSLPDPIGNKISIETKMDDYLLPNSLTPTPQGAATHGFLAIRFATIPPAQDRGMVRYAVRFYDVWDQECGALITTGAPDAPPGAIVMEPLLQ